MTLFNIVEAGTPHNKGTQFKATILFTGSVSIQSVMLFEGVVEIVTNDAFNLIETDGVFHLEVKK